MILLYTVTILCFLALLYQWFSLLTKDNARFKDGFMYGVGAAFLVQSLIQDVFGQQAYVAMISSAWVSGWITVPFAIFGILFMALTLFIGYRIVLPAVEKKEREEQKKKEESNG